MKTTSKVAWLVCTLCLGFLPHTAGAWLATGADLNTWGQAKQRIDAGRERATDYQDSAWFIGYVIAIADQMAAENDKDFKSCFGRKVTRGQFGAIALQYIAAHPEQWSQPGMVLVRNAIIEACNKNFSAQLPR